MNPNRDFISERMCQMVQAIQSDVSDSFMTDFSKLTTDDERVAFIWKTPAFHEVCDLEPEYCAKSATDAMKFRQIGNKYFQKKAYLSAVGEYSKSIICSPPQKNSDLDDNHLALAYANRSAALFHFGKFEDSLVDIEQAFVENYPKDLAYKLYDRQGKCYAELNQVSKARRSFSLAQASLSDATLDGKYLDIWKNNLRNQMEKYGVMEDCQDTKEAKMQSKAIPSISGSNEQCPSASGSVQVNYNEKRGRHVVASDDIRLGDVLMVDSPFSSVLYPQFYLSHCYRCAKKVTVPYPCPTCSSVVFCNLECKKYAMCKYHQDECQYLAVLDGTLCGKYGHLALRLVMETGVETLQNYIKEQKLVREENEKKKITKLKIYPGDYNTVYSLTTSAALRSPEKLLPTTVLACFLLKLLKLISSSDSSGINSEDVLVSLGGVIMRHLELLQCNAFRITELQNPTSFDDPKPAELGIGIYPTAAMLNHSCDPLVDVSFYDNKLVVRALRNIAAGEEIVCSYGPIFYDMRNFKRIPALKETYFFTCKCVACKEDWACWQDLQCFDPEWLCEACGRKLICEELEDKKIAKCKACSHKQNLEECITKLGESHDRYSKSMAEALSGHVENALPGIGEHMQLLQKYLMQPWRDYTAAQVALRQCFRLLANKKE